MSGFSVDGCCCVLRCGSKHNVKLVFGQGVWEAACPMVSQEPYIQEVMYLGDLFTLEWLASNDRIWQKWRDTRQGFGYQSLWFPPCLLFYCLLCSLWRRSASMEWNALRRSPMWLGIGRWGLEPRGQWLSLEVARPPQESLGRTSSGQNFDFCLVRIPEPETPKAVLGFLPHCNYKIMFVMLSYNIFGVIYYVDIDS